MLFHTYPFTIAPSEYQVKLSLTTSIQSNSLQLPPIDNQIGLLGSITPAITFAVSPLWGALADSKNWHKQIMVFTFMGSVLLRTLLVYNTKNVLWFSLIVALSATLNAPVKPLMDTAVMGVLKDKSDYGRCRLFGQCGFGLGSFLSGNFLAGNVQGIFTVQCLLALPSMILMMLFSPKTSEKSTENVDISKAIYYVLKDLKTLVFFFAVLNIGIMSGIIENFCYVRLMELPNIKNTNILGTCRFIGSLCGMPMFYFSGKISKLVNVNLILTFSFLAFIARFIIYAIVTNPWYALPAEIIRGVTFAGFWAGCTQFVYNASPVGLTATMVRTAVHVYVPPVCSVCLYKQGRTFATASVRKGECAYVSVSARKSVSMYLRVLIMISILYP